MTPLRTVICPRCGDPVRITEEYAAATKGEFDANFCDRCWALSKKPRRAAGR